MTSLKKGPYETILQKAITLSEFGFISSLSSLQSGLYQCLQLDRVGSKLSDALRELLDSHLVLIVLVTEGSLI